MSRKNLGISPEPAASRNLGRDAAVRGGKPPDLAKTQLRPSLAAQTFQRGNRLQKKENFIITATGTGWKTSRPGENTAAPFSCCPDIPARKTTSEKENLSRASRHLGRSRTWAARSGRSLRWTTRLNDDEGAQVESASSRHLGSILDSSRKAKASAFFLPVHNIQRGRLDFRRRESSINLRR